MGRLVAKQLNVLFPPINKGISIVERSFRRYSSLRQVKSSPESLPKSSPTKIFLNKAPTALQSNNYPQSLFDLRRRFQALKSTLCRGEELIYDFAAYSDSGALQTRG
ncbi:hypothetical protein M9H77_23136 [Catharanthus roseus]|uniref:Uncharacterized protein n=1 Tax=Catharanthus roseus TaxID=4058 RepID=A0ACC0AV59_CATRO|nr:hypothetical protein M9H77_23136 [Catharanthus roseus]